MKQKYLKFKNYYLLITKLFKYYDEEHRRYNNIYKEVSPAVNLQKNKCILIIHQQNVGKIITCT